MFDCASKPIVRRAFPEGPRTSASLLRDFPWKYGDAETGVGASAVVLSARESAGGLLLEGIEPWKYC